MNVSSSNEKLDSSSVITRLILQHVKNERLDYAELVEKINNNRWVLMKELPGDDDQNAAGLSMCEIVHAHGEYATVRPCCKDSEAYFPGMGIYVIHLARWSEFFVQFHMDYYDFAEYTPGTSRTLIEKSKSNKRQRCK